MVLRYSEVSNLDEEDQALVDSLAPPAPISLRLEDKGFLGSEGFRIETTYYLGAKEVPVRRTGPFIQFHDRVCQLPWAAFDLIQSLDEINESETERGVDPDQLLRSWGKARAIAKEVGADLSKYLEEEEVIVADRVAPEVVESQAGHTSIVPEFAGVPNDELQAEYLKHGDVPSRYVVSNARGHKIRIVLEPEVRKVLETWTAFRRMSPRERDRVLSDPMLLLPEDVSEDVVDLAQYGPRVRAIGEYASSVRAFVSSGQRWDDLGEDEADPADREIEGFGIEVSGIDGETERIEFDDVETVVALVEKIRKAIRENEPVVDFEGKKLPANQDLVDDLDDLIRIVQDRSDDEQDDVEEPNMKPRGVGLLIYTNEEELEFTLPPEEREALDTDRFIPPEALLPHVELKPHQQQGIAWLVHGHAARRPGVLLADDMGLGKTLQALTFLAWLIENSLSESLGAPEPPWDPILVVAPPTLLSVWTKEIDDFFDPSVFLPYQILTTEEARKMRVASGRESEVGKPVLDVARIRDHRMVLTSYQTLSAYGLSLGQLDWSVIVCDEAQALKDPNTRTSIVFKALKSQFRLAMTGTPVETRLLDVWNLFDSLHPGLLGSAKDFSALYEPKDSEGRLEPSSGAAQDLAGRIGVAGSGSIAKGTRLLRRTKEDELKDLPRKRVRRVDSNLGEAQRNAYLSVIQGFRASSKRGKSLEMLGQLNRLCQHPRLLGGDIIGASPSELIQDCPKLESLIETLDEISKRGEKVLIFAHFRDAQMILQRVIDDRYGITTPILNGDRSQGTKRVHEARMEMISRFESTPGFHAMIVSPRVGGVGLTITAANHVVHYGRWWNPAREDQCTDRVYRIGQERDVTVYRLVSQDPKGEFRTFDERLDDLLEQRRSTADSFLVPQADEGRLARDLVGAMTSSGEDDVLEPEDSPPLRTRGDVELVSPEAFEALCAALYSGDGYETYLTPFVNDGGVDVVACSATEVVLVQCKHTRARHALDAALIGELDDGELYYRERVLPQELIQNRRLRCVVMTNAPRSRALSRAAGEADTELVTDKELRRLLKRIDVRPSSIAQWLGSRESSLISLGSSLRDASATT